MTENYIVLKNKRYDIVLPEEHNCDEHKTCKECPLDSKGCTNIIDFINDTLDTNCEQGVMIINHEKNMIGYVAKDRDNKLFLYDEKPEYDDSIEQWVAGGYMFIENIDICNKFKDLSYTDEPIKVEIKLERL